jgi:hypothetical protein
MHLSDHLPDLDGGGLRDSFPPIELDWTRPDWLRSQPIADQKGISVPDDVAAAVQLTPAKFHGELNYTIAA